MLLPEITETESPKVKYKLLGLFFKFHKRFRSMARFGGLGLDCRCKR
jgi:hypothetical protein